ncbi:hypothetical protein HFN60_07315 [Rhizobium leguminosarum]|nr:hypothetical protein [Rhizobium leguminosarum]
MNFLQPVRKVRSLPDGTRPHGAWARGGFGRATAEGRLSVLDVADRLLDAVKDWQSSVKLD